MKRFILCLAIILLSAYIVKGALIHGTIYDISLNIAKDVKVTIDTQPKQFFVSKNGTYSFNVPIGHYKITAERYAKDFLISSVEENITITNEGSYIVDLILFPNLDYENELLEEPDLAVSDDYFKKLNILPYFLLILFFIVIITFIIYKRVKNRKTEITANIKEPEISSDLGGIMKIIQEEGGRTTQKEIRKRIPLSEAKISLMISELEHKGIIEKIKKGRGNIIIKKGG